MKPSSFWVVSAAALMVVGEAQAADILYRMDFVNGRCIYRGKSVWEAYITLADGKCVQARCKPKEHLLHFIP
ncbi:hypothetical protein HPB52_007639 [Rhipicephalus sanguineus]|uniref:Uncharacterized protein n=1 Tax=Rhipicephalus sanguineus TaxID=34632 RepID=A0A9D4Q5F9_RHISA|nr:hypothetical protein HPB52_007639 [Rhipicephalus sanguineus]